ALSIIGYINALNMISYNSFSPPPMSVGQTSLFLDQYVLANNRIIIMAGLQVSSHMYAHSIINNYSLIDKLIFANIYINNNVSKMYQTVRGSANIVIITSHDLRYHLFSDIWLNTSIPGQQVQDFFNMLLLHNNLCYNDGKYYVFLLQKK
ncbi:MAG: hypothetical protein ACP5IE_08215, partial [Infirmifilum sp.]